MIVYGNDDAPTVCRVSWSYHVKPVRTAKIWDFFVGGFLQRWQMCQVLSEGPFFVLIALVYLSRLKKFSIRTKMSTSLRACLDS